MASQIRDKIRAGGFFLFLKEQKSLEFLLLKHPYRWDLPKGHCESGETFLDAAIRELKEETGIQKNQIAIDPIFQFEICYPVTYTDPSPATYHKQVVYFLAFLSTKPKLKLTEHDSFRWHEWDPRVKIQEETIDPLVQAVAKHFASLGNKESE